MGTMEWMHVPQGEFDLARFPADEKDPLRAWNAADEYLLTEVANVTPGGSVVLLNDSWGALAVSIPGRHASTSGLAVFTLIRPSM